MNKSWVHWKHALILAVTDFFLFLSLFFGFLCPTVVDAVILKQAIYSFIIFSITAVIWIFYISSQQPFQLFIWSLGVFGTGLVLLGLANLATTIAWGVQLSLCYLTTIIPILIGLFLIILSGTFLMVNQLGQN
ncbi:MAG: hypothetical protein ACFFCH_10710 [Promethearchaeota archaeon]